MDTIDIFSKKQTRAVLRALRRMGVSVQGTVVESTVLPTSEVLLLFKIEQTGRYVLYLLGGSRIMPLLMVREDMNAAQAAVIIPQTVLTLIGQQAVFNFNPTRYGVRQGVRTLTSAAS